MRSVPTVLAAASSAITPTGPIIIHDPLAPAFATGWDDTTVTMLHLPERT